MKTPPEVSVIIPAFNAQRFLLETVNSVLVQTFRRVEVIIVDDGSTDSTLRLARAIVDPGVTVITQPNEGQATARNRGLAAASSASRYVAFVDADDVWDPGKIEAQVAHLEADTEAVAVGCFMRYLSATGKPLGKTGRVVAEEDRLQIAQGLLLPFPISSCLIRKAVVEELGGFDPQLREAEDLELYAGLAQAGKLGCIPEVMGSYRVHPGSASAKKRASMNLFVRFVQQRLAARAAGGDLSWDDFHRNYSLTLGERYRDHVTAWYRSAGLWQLEGRPARAAFFATLAAFASPRYTFPRLYHQFIAR